MARSSSTTLDNFHGRDQTVDGQNLTAAVDISVRGLDAESIRHLLSAVAQIGFAA